MRKRISRIMLIVFSIITISLVISSASYAYTEEEKQQAKAWLSAHGYSPDRGGAAQAYQDYLDGKFDEELGINTTEQENTDDAMTDKEGATTEGAGTDGKDAATNGTVADGKVTDVDEENIVEGSDEGNHDASKQSGNIQGNAVEKDENAREVQGQTAGIMKDRKISGEVFENNPVAEGKDATLGVLGHEESKRLDVVTMYREENTDTYKEAGAVILFSVLFMVVLEAILVLCR